MDFVLKKNKRNFRPGYSLTSYIFARLANGMAALFFLLLSLPVMILTSIAVVFLLGRPVLYSGTRLGQRKRSFTMYKFRTLPKDFQNKNRAQLVSHRHGRQPLISQFMRETRIDELPQLLNILKGDMDFMGPRPIRPEVYNAYCRKINGYDKRFSVKPGLIGYSQLLTPHSAPKRLRSHMDNRAVLNERRIFFNIYIVMLTIYVVMRRTVKMGYKILITNVLKMKLLKQYNEKRGFDRIRLKKGFFYLYENRTDCLSCLYSDLYETDCIAKGRIFDINEEYIRLDTNDHFNDSELLLKISVKGKTRGSKPLSKSCVCRGVVYKTYETGKNFKYTYIIKYKPVTELNQYMVDQYFLSKSLIQYVF
ncbi:MAG: sugar transferase [Thermodesulfobacteriota bacterium]|nr:sugar transferase [Thermodesulfobacteriota bacterium]